MPVLPKEEEEGEVVAVVAVVLEEVVQDLKCRRTVEEMHLLNGPASGSSDRWKVQMATTLRLRPKV